jgi:hypothetical protein
MYRMYSFSTQHHYLQQTDRSSNCASNRKASANTIVRISRQYKLNVNIFTPPFTTFVELVLYEKGKLVDKFLAHTIVADRGKEGSDIVNGQSPKDLDTLVIVLAQAKAVERQDYRKQFNCLACAYIQANAIVQQLFNFCKVIAMSLCRRELYLSIRKPMRGISPMSSFAIAIARGERSPPIG